MIKFALRSLMASTLLVAAIGCENMGGGGNSGKTLDRKQSQDVSADGRVATQTRTQTRQTDDGSVVKETETRQREVVQPGQSGNTDATQK